MLYIIYCLRGHMAAINPHPVCSLRRTSECVYIPSSMGTASSTPYRMEIKVFYHIYCNRHTLPIAKDQIAKIIFSGLYEKTSAIYCFITGEPKYIPKVAEWIQKSGVKFHIAKCIPNDTTYERFTLLEIPKYVAPKDKFLYIHTKGITKPDNQCIHDWRTYMEYFVIGKHAECIHALDTYDLIGVNLQHVPHNHYSGNFWWSTGKYYLSLDFDALRTDMDYNAPEYFVCKKNPRCVNFCNIGNFIRHYEDPCPTGYYIDHITPR